MTSFRRGVGYCQNADCPDHLKGVFLINHGDTFYCPTCRRYGMVVQEVGSAENQKEIFKEARIEYNYDPSRQVYQEIAIVRDNSILGPANIYVLRSPLIKTEKRALKVAEAILSNLQRFGLQNGAPRETETVLSLDDSREDFKEKLRALQRDLENSHLSRNREGVSA